MEMQIEKTNLAKLLLTHLDRNLKKEMYCENFSSFYGEGENINRRYLLDEYLEKNGTPYFNSEEAKSICPKFRLVHLEKDNKCSIDGIIKPEEIPHNNELLALLKKFKERYQKKEETTTQRI